MRRDTSKFVVQTVVVTMMTCKNCNRKSYPWDEKWIALHSDCKLKKALLSTYKKCRCCQKKIQPDYIINAQEEKDIHAIFYCIDCWTECQSDGACL